MPTARTALVTTRDSAGSLTLYKYTFTATIANTDTFAWLSTTTGNPVPIAYWTNSSAAGSGVAYSAGTFTFYMASTAACQLFVLVRI
jgi:hypothetical protein